MRLWLWVSDSTSSSETSTLSSESSSDDSDSDDIDNNQLILQTKKNIKPAVDNAKNINIVVPDASNINSNTEEGILNTGEDTVSNNLIGESRNVIEEVKEKTTEDRLELFAQQDVEQPPVKRKRSGLVQEILISVSIQLHIYIILFLFCYIENVCIKSDAKEMIV